MLKRNAMHYDMSKNPWPFLGLLEASFPLLQWISEKKVVQFDGIVFSSAISG